MVTKQTCRALLFAMATALVFGCSKQADEPPEDNVFKGYQDSLEKAKQVNPMLQDAEEKRRKQLEEATQ